MVRARRPNPHAGRLRSPQSSVPIRVIRGSNGPFPAIFQAFPPFLVERRPLLAAGTAFLRAGAALSDARTAFFRAGAAFLSAGRPFFRTGTPLFPAGMALLGKRTVILPEGAVVPPFEAMGYVRKSERQSGLTKKKNAAPAAAGR